MRKAFDFVKANKKIIIVITLLIIILGTLYFINKGAQSPTAATFSTQEKSPTEQKLIRILSSIDGVGDTDVMINESDGNITGIIIVCGGAENIMVRSNILNAVSTAFDIDKKNIVIYSMK